MWSEGLLWFYERFYLFLSCARTSLELSQFCVYLEYDVAFDSVHDAMSLFIVFMMLNMSALTVPETVPPPRTDTRNKNQ